MAHFQPTRSSWALGDVLTPADVRDLDSKTSRAVNGDDGGLWAPAAPIVIRGAGVRMPAPFVIEGGGELRIADGGRLVLSELPELGVDHPGRTRTVFESFQLAAADHPVTTESMGGPLQTITPGTALWLPLRLPHGATLREVVVRFRAPFAHGAGVPAVMPMVRVRRVSADGEAREPLRAAVAGDVAGGFVSVPAPTDGGAWHAVGAPQIITYACTANAAIDTSRFLYFVDVVDESGTNAFPTSTGGAGNVWLVAECHLDDVPAWGAS